jgi:streptogramin lyase
MLRAGRELTLVVAALSLVSGGGAKTLSNGRNPSIPTDPALSGQGGERVWVAARNGGVVWVVEATTGEVMGEVALPRGGVPGGLAVSPEALWVADFSGWVHRVDPRTGTPTASGRGFGYAADLAASSAAIWVSNGDFGWISRFDPESGAVVDSVEIGWSVLDLVISGEALWVASDGSRGGRLSRVPIAGPAVLDSLELEWRPEALAAGAGALWVHDAGFGRVHKLDLSSGASLATIALGAEMYEGRGIAVGEGGLWVAMGVEEVVIRVDPDTGSVRRIPVGGFVQDVAAGAGAVWAVLPEDDLLLKIDPSSLEVLARIPVEGYPVTAAVR